MPTVPSLKTFVAFILLFISLAGNSWAQPTKTNLLKRDTLYDKYMDFYVPRIKTRIKQLNLENSKKKNALIKLDLLDADRYRNKGEYHKALPLYLAILEDYAPLTPVDSAYILNDVLRCYYEIKDLKHTIYYYNKLVRIKARHKEIQSVWFRIYLSNIYYNLGFYNEALREQLKEKKDFMQGDYSMAGFYNNRGLYWTKAGNTDSALYNFNESLKYANRVEPRRPSLIALINGNIGQVYIQEKKYKQAIPLLLMDTRVSKQDTNFLNVAVNYLELSICYNALDQPRTALQYLDSFAVIKSERIDDVMRLRYLKQKSEAYLKMGLKDSTIKSFQAYIAKNTEYENQKKREMIYNLKVSQEVFELQSEIEEKKIELKKKRAGLDYEKSLRRTYIYAILLLSALTVIILSLVFKLNRRRKLLEVKNQKITHQYELIYKSLNDKEVLIKEIHHRVKNNLQLVSSLIRLQLHNQTHEQTRTALSETNDRIISMSLLHQQLMIRNDESVIEISGFIVNLVKHLQGSLLGKEKNIEITYDIEQLYLPIDMASPICLIINEVLVNSIKHAFPDFSQSNITISLHEVNRQVELVIRDNGKGFDYDAARSGEPSLGLELIETLSEQLNGRSEFLNQNGTVFRLILPPVPNKHAFN